MLDTVIEVVGERMLRYDITGEFEFLDDFGWLDITHGLTYADAVRWHHRLDHPDIECRDIAALVALGEETLDFRMKSASVKVDQVKATRAEILATACENCHTQLSNLNDHYKMEVDVQFLSSMVADALVQ